MSEKRLHDLETDVDAAFAHLAAIEAALLALTRLLREPLPGLPEALSRLLMDRLSVENRAAGGRGAERNAAEIERLAERVQSLAHPPRPAPE